LHPVLRCGSRLSARLAVRTSLPSRAGQQPLYAATVVEGAQDRTLGRRSGVNRFAVFAVISSALALASTRPARNSNSRLVFGEQDQWVLFDPVTRAIDRISFPVKRVAAVSISHDAQKFALVAPAVGIDGDALWIWSRGRSGARMLVANGGRYSDPAFAPDDSWIYYSHAPLSGRTHTFGTYAQLFRIRVDGSGSEQVTDENGCHFGARFHRRYLSYIHSSCTGRSSFKRAFGRGSSPKVLVTTTGLIDEALTSEDGRSTLFVINQPDGFLLREVRDEGEPLTIAELPRRTSRLRPAFGVRRGEILYQNDGRIWLLRDGRHEVIASLTEQEVAP
jgi:hypothetical protein